MQGPTLNSRVLLAYRDQWADVLRPGFTGGEVGQYQEARPTFRMAVARSSLEMPMQGTVTDAVRSEANRARWVDRLVPYMMVGYCEV